MQYGQSVRQGNLKTNSSENFGMATDRLALPVILYFFAVMTPIFINIGPLQMSLMRLLLLLLIVPMTLQLLSGKYGAVRAVDYLFFGYIAFMTLSLAVNNPNRVIENTGAAAIEFLGGYVLGRCCIRDRSSFISMVKLLAFLTACTLPLALLESQTGNPIILDILRRIPGISTHFNVYHEPRMGLLRSQTLFAHPIHYGLFASMSFALVWVGLANVVSNTNRYLLTACVGLCVFLSLSSGALLAVILQLFLIGWAAAFRSYNRRWLILLGLIAAAYVLVDLLSNRSPLEVFMSYATFSAHNAYWRSIIFDWGIMNIFGSSEQNIPSARLFGIGLSDWIRPSFMHSGSMDNFWLVQGVRYGIPAFLCLSVGYGWVLWKMGWRDLGNDQVLLDLRRAWMFAFIGMTFTLATVHIWTTLYSFTFFMFGTGIWILSAEPKSENTQPETPNSSPSGSAYTRFPQGSYLPQHRSTIDRIIRTSSKAKSLSYARRHPG